VPRDWLGRTSPFLYRVGRETLTQSIVTAVDDGVIDRTLDSQSKAHWFSSQFVPLSCSNSCTHTCDFTSLVGFQCTALFTDCSALDDDQDGGWVNVSSGTGSPG